MLALRTITVSGTPTTMGQAHGEQLRELIAAFVRQRMVAARAYLSERGLRDQQAFLTLGRQCLDHLRTWDADGWAEHIATAAGAGVDATELYTAGNMTDIRDILALGGPADGEGCTAVLLPPALTQAGQVIAAQTWDLNPTDLDYVVAIHRQPSHSPATWSITCAGCPSLVGMNEHGVSVGTTNIKTRGSRIGIPYLSLLHRMLGCQDFAAAAQVIEQAPRAAAHTYWVAAPRAAALWECTATTHVRRDLATAAIIQTNHCQVPAHQTREGEPASASSLKRLARAGALAQAGGHDVTSLRALFSDRADGVDAINRFAEDQQGTSTNACLIAIPATRELHACRGSADRGAWTQLRFDTRPS